MYRYFSKAELSCRCGCGQAKMDPDFMMWLEKLRETCGFPFPVSSAYRCPAHNSKVSSTGENGPHTTGKAIDIVVQGARAHILIRQAMNMGVSGLGVHQRGTGRFIHLDLITEGPRPNVWSY